MRPRIDVLFLSLIIAFLAPTSICLAQAGQATQAPDAQKPTKELKLDTGKEIFEAACIGCHGPQGKGQPQSTLGFEPPSTFPDFTDCGGTTPERDIDWKSTIHEGGPGRGFSQIMPSFAEALTLQQIDSLVAYLRQQCTEAAWPRGELNLPRPLVTEKAFPEDEAVWTAGGNASGPGSVSTGIVYERRFGLRNQIELFAPFNFVQRDNGKWVGGVGDMVFGFKRVMISTLKTGSILSLQGELAVPTGNQRSGLGTGVTTFETFAAFGQLLPRFSFLQIQAGGEVPTNNKAPKAVFWRANLGKTFSQNQGFGREWTPMAEFLADRDLLTGAKTNWDVVPEMQVTLSRRQHVRLNIGVRTPINNTAGRSTQVLFYLLWDWFDGALREGW
jgi:mono/diheme cytochrome c family protein